MRPLTMPEAEARGLIVEDGVGTFPNGSSWLDWADGNCHQCRYYDRNAMGALCAFEGAAFMHMCSAELRAMFGWTEHPEYGYHVPPDQCPFFREHGDDNDPPEPPPNDPRQLVLIADPTEAIAGLTPAPADVLAHA